MMPLNNLSIGNYVQLMYRDAEVILGKPRIGTVKSINEDESLVVKFHDGYLPKESPTDIDHIHSIEISVKWLNEFRFKPYLQERDWAVWRRDSVELIVTTEEFIFFSFDNMRMFKFQYVHQLQNQFAVLTFGNLLNI